MRSTRRRRSPSLAWIWLARLSRMLRWFVLGSPRLVMATLLISLVVGGTWYAWRRVAPLVTVGNHYRLDPLTIEITPPPAWIRADIRAEVVRDASLDDGLSILDPTLARRVADAFEFHPWIDKVVRVTKLAGPRIAVQIVYRRPVAMVHLSEGTTASLIPVDSQGVRLPGADFTPQQKERYPQISGIATVPLVGQRWNDPQAIGASQLAVVLADVWHELQLAVIRPTSRPATPVDTPPEDIASAAYEYTTYEILTRGGTRILWGFAPQVAVSGEPSAAEKVARLTRYAKEHGGLNTGSQGRTLDVRRLPADERTAAGTPALRTDGRQQR